ncbi:hypothetical protein D9M71_509270 [compost metagenome]
MATMSNHSGEPSFGVEYWISTPLLASLARVAACSTSPEKPTTMQISPLARSLTYFDEWK